MAATESLSLVTPDMPIFLSFDGNSVIDLGLKSSKVKAKIMRHYVDDEEELFTGAPRRGYVPLLSNLALRTPSKDITETRHHYSRLGYRES